MLVTPIGDNPAEVQIGLATVYAGEIRRQNYATASWYTVLDREEQTVPVYAKLANGGNTVVDTSFRFTTAGIITDAHFPSSLFGHTTPGDRPEMIGKPDTHTISPYAHAVARAILEERPYGWEFESAENLSALWVPYGGVDHHPGVTTNLIVDATDEQLAKHTGCVLAMNREPIPHKDPVATYGWAIQKASEALDLNRRAELELGSARSAMRMYGPKTDPVLAGRSNA